MHTRRSFLSALGGTFAVPLAASIAGCSSDGSDTAGGTESAAVPDTTAVRKIGFDGPVGVQLYSVRRELAQDVPGTLRAVRDAGYSEVEVFSLHDMPVENFGNLLAETGLACTSYMADYGRVVNETDDVAREAKTLGASYVVVSWVPHDEPFDEQDLARAVADFTKAGRALKDQGLRFCYHAHGYEFQPDAAGGTLFDRFMEATEPGVVDVEMDVFWITWPGQDPVALLEKYPGRFPLFHLKDMKKGTQTGTVSGSAPLETNVPVGEGQIDFPTILEAAERSGGERYYVEYEHTDALNAIRKSYEYLQALQA